MTRILIAEDHRLVSEGLQTMLSMVGEAELVGVATTGDEAVARVKREEVDIVLMDVNLSSEMNGIEATKVIKATKPDIKILMLTMYTDQSTVAQALKAGADGYLSKGASKEVVAKAIEDVMAGRSVLDPVVTEGVLGRLEGRNPSALSDREQEILQLLADGKSTRDIAQEIHIAEETVKTNLKHMFRKLSVRDRTEAVAEAFRRGMVR